VRDASTDLHRSIRRQNRPETTRCRRYSNSRPPAQDKQGGSQAHHGTQKCPPQIEVGHCSLELLVKRCRPQLSERSPICTRQRNVPSSAHVGVSCPAVPSHPFPNAVRSLAKAHGHCLSNIAHSAGARELPSCRHRSLAVIPTAKRAIRVHDAASTPKFPHSGQDRGVQASRPPLRFVFPVYPDVRARGVVSLTAGFGSDGAVRT
jgi:hypothetical protein